MKKDFESIKVTAESVPFSFLTRHCSQEICPAPLACVTDFVGVVFHLLAEKNRYIPAVHIIKQTTCINGLGQLT